MTRTETITFLQTHQPMPPDELLTQELIDEYCSVVKFFEEHPDKEAIPLLLRSFGEWDCYGVYSSAEKVFFKCDVEDMVLALKAILEDRSIPCSIRYRATYSAGDFADIRLRYGVSISLESSNEDIREAATDVIEWYDKLDLK